VSAQVALARLADLAGSVIDPDLQPALAAAVERRAPQLLADPEPA
jgi:hypothetical protein